MADKTLRSITFPGLGDRYVIPEQVSIDATLSQQGKAADAKAVGDAINDLENGMLSYGKQDDLSYLALEYQGSYIGNDETEVVANLAAHTDYIEIPDGAEQIICGNLTSNSSGTTYHLYPNVIFYDAAKNKIITNTSQDNVATYNIPSAAKYVRVNQPSLIAPVKQALIKFVVPDYSGFVGYGNITFTSTAESKGTVIYLDAGKNYVINCLTEITSGNVNFYVYNDNDVYVPFYRKGAKSFTPSKSGYLYAYNVGGTVTGKVSVSVYEADGILAKLREVPTIYEVGATKANKSLTALLLALKDDNTEKTIYLDGGDYDIFQEYTDLGLLSGDPPSDPTTGYFDYNVWIPDNTHIIGRGLVRLLWQPTTDQISAAWSKTISPVNVAGSMTLENVEIYCKNGRYCIHDDPLGKRQYTDARKVYKNVKCYKYANDTGYGFNPVIGFGIDTRMNYVFDNCEFVHYGNLNCFYLHDRTTTPNTENAGSTITVNNCVMVTTGFGVYLGNTGTGTGNHHIRMTFADCYIGGSFNIGDEGAITQGTKPNHFDVTLLDCNDINVQIASSVNPYPLKVYSSLTTVKNAISQLEDQVVTDVTVSGTIVSITAEANKRYLCGTVASIDVTPCVSGAFDLIFTSGSTAAVLTIPNTVKWQDSSFDPSALDADTTYEISVAEGTLGLVASWT